MSSMKGLLFSPSLTCSLVSNDPFFSELLTFTKPGVKCRAAAVKDLSILYP